MTYSGPPIRGNFSGGNFKVQGSGGGIKAGGASLAKAANNNSGCWNNLQCEDQFDARYGCVNSAGTGDCNNIGANPDVNCYCKCLNDNTELGPCNTPTPTPTSPTPTPTSPTPTPTSTPGLTPTYSYMNMIDAF